MGWHFTKAAFCAAVVFSMLMSTSASAADPMGAVVAVEGRPTAAGPAGSRPLSAGSDVFEGDTVVVGDGNAQLQLDDGTKIVVGPSSRLILQAYLRRNSTTASKVGIKALRGTFRFITGKSPKSAYNINTSNATIGIRGTGFDFKVNNKTLLAVLEGAVKLRGRNGQSVNAKSGCGVAEAGGSATKARELKGTAKANALQSQFQFINDQGGLRPSFRLPVENCLVFLGSNESPATQPGITPEKLAPFTPLLAVPVIAGVLLDKDSVSPESGIRIGFPPYCDTPQYPVPCK